MTAVTALADVDICSMALSHLGISQTIQSLDPPDQSAQGQACAFWYPKMRNWLLQNAPWNFAYVAQILASDATTIPGWTYAYQYPNDCLQGIAVSTSAGRRLVSSSWFSYWNAFNGSVPKVPWQVMQSQVAGKAILCDIASPAYLFYIQCVTDTSLMSPMFIDCLSFYVASRIGNPLRSDLKRVQLCAQAAEGMRLQALAQCLNEAQEDQERVSPSISVR